MLIVLLDYVVTTIISAQGNWTQSSLNQIDILLTLPFLLILIVSDINCTRK